MFWVVTAFLVGHALATCPDAAQCGEQDDHAVMLQVNKNVEQSENGGSEPEIAEDSESEEVAAVQSTSAAGLWEEQFYINGMRSCPNLIGMRPKKLTSVSQPSYTNTGGVWPGFSARDNFAARWTGYVNLQKIGSYYFYTYSDDGSRLYIANRLVVNNDGLHGWRLRSGRTTTTSSGATPLRLEFFERGGHAGIRVDYKGADTGGRKVVLPRAVLTRDTQFKHPPTPAPPPPGTKVCGFESGSKPYCGVWADSRNDKFDWTRKNGRTPSSRTGPSSAKKGSYYLFIETSCPRRTGDTAVLSATNVALKQSASLKFDYHMYGGSMGSLKVMVDGSSVQQYSGNKGNKWVKGSVDLSRFAGKTVTLSFVGTRGRSWQGDLAIDNVELFEGATPTTTVAPTTVPQTTVAPTTVAPPTTAKSIVTPPPTTAAPPTNQPPVPPVPTQPPVPPGVPKKIDEITKKMDELLKLLMKLISTTMAPPPLN
jgi:hypothetical protein